MTTPESPITLRPATLQDAELVFRWRNDPFIVAQGSLSREVPWAEHEKWFADTIQRENRRMFIVLHNGQPAGQIRFERLHHSDCVLSVYLAREFTGKGWGLQAIDLGCRTIFQHWPVSRVVACVRADNRSGYSAFRKAGFAEEKIPTLCSQGHFSFVLRRTAAASR